MIKCRLCGRKIGAKAEPYAQIVVSAQKYVLTYDKLKTEISIVSDSRYCERCGELVMRWLRDNLDWELSKLDLYELNK